MLPRLTQPQKSVSPQIPMLQERYSNADLHHPSPMLWGARDRNQQHGGGQQHYNPHHHQQQPAFYNRAMANPVAQRSTQQGAWYQVS